MSSLCTALVAATQAIDQQGAGATFGYTVSTAGVGTLMLALAGIRTNTSQINAGRGGGRPARSSVFLR